MSTRIEDDTPILTWVVAETVCDRAGVARDHAPALVARAEQVYAHNARFRRTIRSAGNKGRDTLYVFMRHWLDARLLRIP